MNARASVFFATERIFPAPVVGTVGDKAHKLLIFLAFMIHENTTALATQTRNATRIDGVPRVS
jgi:hypothetical protein